MNVELRADIAISGSQLDHFNKHGFVKLPGLLNRKEVASLREAMADARLKIV